MTCQKIDDVRDRIADPSVPESDLGPAREVDWATWPASAVGGGQLVQGNRSRQNQTLMPIRICKNSIGHPFVT